MNTPTDLTLAGHQRLYRTFLLAYPRAFRQVYGADMVQVFGDKLRAERQRRGRRASVGVWFLTLLDLFKTAPLQRMEKKMTREAAFAVLAALFIASVVAVAMMGSAGPGMPAALGALVVAAGAFAATGMFKKNRAVGNTPAGRLTGREWWVVLAGILGAVEIVMLAGKLISEPSKENAFALAFVGGFGTLALVGTWFRSRSRSTGDWMMIVGVLPFSALFWAVWPPVVALIVVVMALIDSTKGRVKDAPTVEA